MSKLKDRTGIRYGHLVAKEYVGNSKWLCECDCGNTKIVYGGHLENGHTKSCGCIRPPRTNLYGQVFGYLTVIDWAGNGKWICKCKCGNEILVKTDNLKSGNTKSCGCYQKERTSEASLKSLIGQRFGKLTVIQRVENNRFNHICYLCKCDCGGETIVDATNLRNGNTNSCGCIKSKGEMKIQQYLQKENIKYQSQYSFDDIFLSTGRRPFYDFAIFDENNKIKYIIEYQGKQHYTYSGYGWDNEENFILTQRRDKEKKEALIKKKIPFYEIPYWELDNIEKVLEGIIKDTAAAPDMEEAQEIEIEKE